jgi:hypothetical protein
MTSANSASRLLLDCEGKKKQSYVNVLEAHKEFGVKYSYKN